MNEMRPKNILIASGVLVGLMASACEDRVRVQIKVRTADAGNEAVSATPPPSETKTPTTAAPAVR